MDKIIADRILALQEQAKSDPDYLRLCEEAPAVEEALSVMLAQLPRDQQNTLLDYLEFYWDLYWTMLRIACTNPQSSHFT